MRRLLISGEIDSGKTSLCERVARELKSRGWDTAGVLTRGIFLDQEKIGFEVVDLRSGGSRQLAVLKKPSMASEGPQTKRWVFNQDSLSWANLVLRDAVPCQALFVDELGPLEFTQGNGLLAGIEAVNSGQYTAALVVIREHLIDQGRNLWPDSRLIRVGSLDSIQQQADQLLAELGSPPALAR